jgi:tetratricopeptide (TPR) repeat protein
MSFFSRFFGRKPEPEKRPAPRPFTPAKVPPGKAPAAPVRPVDPATDPNLICAFDVYGREIFMTKAAWRADVLPGSLKANWNKPNELYGIIINALKDGFRSEVAAAAEQLYKTDAIPARGACVWGIVLKEEGRLDEAERVFRDYLAKHGEEGAILTNLAKVYSQRQEPSRAEEILWRALEVDPNLDNGLIWYQSIHRDRSGEAGAEAALRRVAALPGSWRAQLWLARTALEARQLDEALVLYGESLAHAAKPRPTDLLMQISGDLGNAAHLPELLQLVEPQFVAETHGLPVGNNLIKAHLDLGQLEAARRILNRLYALRRPDWQKTLGYWDTEITKARLATEAADVKAPLNLAMLTIEGPVWLKPSSPAAELFPARPVEVPGICFMGCTAGLATNSQRIQHQLADAPGRLSRALPLFLAEQVEFGCQARVQTLVPWIMGEVPGFVFGGVAWSNEDASHYARQGGQKCDYVVITHLQVRQEPWSVELRLTRTIDARCLGTLPAEFRAADPGEALAELARQLQDLLAREAGVDRQPDPRIYQAPAGRNFSNYLLRLEQLLAIRCAGMEGVKTDFLSGEREIIRGNLELCLACPENAATRILLVQTLLAMKKVRPAIPPEFKDKLALLQKEKPLPEPVNSIVQRMLNEAMQLPG